MEGAKSGYKWCHNFIVPGRSSTSVTVAKKTIKKWISKKGMFQTFLIIIEVIKVNLHYQVYHFNSKISIFEMEKNQSMHVFSLK